MARRTTLESNRKLTTHQKAVLIQVLRTFPDEHVQICYSPSASDGHAYAQDFLAVFKAIGWKVEGPDVTDTMVGQSSGLALIANEAGLPPCVEALRDTLLIYGIEVETQRAELGNNLGKFVLKISRRY